MFKPIILCVVLTFISSACSDEGGRTPEGGDHIWRTQTDAMEKAKQLESVVHDAAQRRREQFERGQ